MSNMKQLMLALIAATAVIMSVSCRKADKEPKPTIPDTGTNIPDEAAANKPLMKDFMGLNGHFQFKPDLYKQVVKQVRNYHIVDWDVAKPGDPITIPNTIN